MLLFAFIKAIPITITRVPALLSLKFRYEGHGSLWNKWKSRTSMSSQKNGGVA
jgi:hypothetical protein